MLKRLFAALILATATLMAQTPSSPDLAGIAHIALRVKDLDASIAFYQKLGFVKAFDLARDGKVYEAFIKINDQQFIELYPVDAKNPQAGFLHVCFQANDILAVHAYYVAQGLKPIDVRKAGAGNLLFTMPGPMTPQGAQNMEYTQYLPGSLHSNDAGKHLGANPVTLVSVEIAALDPAAAKDFYVGKAGFKETAAKGPGDAPTLAIPGAAGEAIVIQKPILGQLASFTLSQAAPLEAVAKTSGTVVSSGVNLTHDPDGNTIFFRRYHVLP